MWVLKIPIDELHLIHRPFEPVTSLARGFAGGLNFGYFSRSQTHPTGSWPCGVVIANGKILNDGHVGPGWPALEHVPDEKEWPVLRTRVRYGLDREWAHVYRIAIQAGPQLVKAGKIATDYKPYPGINLGDSRRVAIGIIDDSHVLVMARDTNWDNMAKWALELGCKEALGGDGGSSASLVIDGKVVYGGNQLVPNALVWERAEVLVRPAETQGTIIPAGDVRAILPLNYFAPWEFACPHCNGILITREAVEVMHRLDALRAEFGSAIGCVPRDRSLARGFTCKERGGHTDSSRHYPPYGDARDISALSRPQSTLAPLVEKYFGEGGIGTYPWGFHVDLGPKRRW